MHAEVGFVDVEGRIVSVTSHRNDDDTVWAIQDFAPTNAAAATRAALATPDERRRPHMDHPGRQEWTWEPATIGVDGVPIAFEVCNLELGFWVAVGRIEEAFIVIDSRGVSLAQVTVERLSEPAPAPPEDAFVGPSPATARFPPDLWNRPQPDPIPAAARVDLACSADGSRLAGVVGDVSVDDALDSTHSVGTARGIVGGADVAVTWTNSEGTPADTDIRTAVAGAVGLGRVALQGVFRGAFMFDEASVQGELAGKHLAVEVVRAAGGWTSDTVGVTGRIGETEFLLYAAVQVGSRRGCVRGSVGAEPVHLDVGAGDSPQDLHVSGCFPGPPELLVLTVAALLYFL